MKNLRTVLVGANEKTLRHYEVVLSQLERFLGKRAEDATAEDVLNFLNYGVSRRGWSRRTVLNYMTTIRSYLRYVGRPEVADQLKPHVKRFSKLPWTPKMPVVATPEEIMKMIEVADNDEYRLFIAIAFFTGLRLGEILSLRVRDVDIKERTIWPERRKFRQDLGGEAGRVVMNRMTATMIASYIKRRGLRPDDMLFKSSPSTFQHHIKLIAKRAGIVKWRQMHPHLLRHWATIAWLREAGGLDMKLSDLEVLAGQMGWRNPGQMIRVYADFAVEDRRKRYDQIFDKS